MIGTEVNMQWMVVLWLQAALASESITVQRPEDVLCPPLVPCERRLDVETLRLANSAGGPLSAEGAELQDNEEESPTTTLLPSSRSAPEHEAEVIAELKDPDAAPDPKPALEQRRRAAPFTSDRPIRRSAERRTRTWRKFNPVWGETEFCECRTISVETVEQKALPGGHRETTEILSPFVEETRTMRVANKESGRRPSVHLHGGPRLEDLTMGMRVPREELVQIRRPNLLSVVRHDFHPQSDESSEERALLEVTTQPPTHYFEEEPESLSEREIGAQYAAFALWNPMSDVWRTHFDSLAHSERGDDELCLMLKHEQRNRGELSGSYAGTVFRPDRTISVRERPGRGSSSRVDYYNHLRRWREDELQRQRTASEVRASSKRPDHWETLLLKGSFQRPHGSRSYEQAWKEQVEVQRTNRYPQRVASLKKIVRKNRRSQSTRRRVRGESLEDEEHFRTSLTEPEQLKNLLLSRSAAEYEEGAPEQDFDSAEDVELNNGECGIGSVKPRVVNGETAAEGQFPWLSYLRIYRDNVSFMCAASILTPRYILTAAHCLLQAGVPPTSMLAVCGVVNKTVGEPIAVHSYKMHPDYGRVPREKHDIALLRLSMSLDTTTARPICVPDGSYEMAESSEDVVATIAGWGFDKDKTKFQDAKRSQLLQFADLKMMPGQICAEYTNLKLVSFDPATQICTLGNGTDACYGDSGGPVMVRQRGRYVQYGVISFGFSCAAPDLPAVSTKVSTHLDWLQSSIHNWQYDSGVITL